jgi:hypothetical protein
MATRSATQRVAASLEPGSRARWATSAKQMRSTARASRRRPSAARRRARPRPRRPKSAIEHEGAAVAAGIDDFYVQTRPGRYSVGRVEETADRSYQAPQCLAVDLVGAAEVVDDLGHGGAGLGVALIVGELQVADH